MTKILAVMLFVLAPIEALAQTSRPAPAAAPQVTIRKDGSERTLPFESAAWLRDLLQALSAAGGGEVDFGPGDYVFEQSVEVGGLRGLRLRGLPGARFRLRAMPEFGELRVLEKAEVKGGRLRISGADLVRVGTRYQVFRADLSGNRQGEFMVTGRLGETITIDAGRNWGVEAFEPGMHLVPELNFFEFHGSEDLGLSGFDFDGGREIADVDLGERPFIGHTAHCGLLFFNGYAADESGRRPTPMKGLEIRDCRFRRFLGRGIAVYNHRVIEIVDCSFTDIGAEAVEIDHCSSEASLKKLEFTRARVGVQLNDARTTEVIRTRFANCGRGIVVKTLIDDPLLNRDHQIRDNAFEGCRAGIILDAGSAACLVAGNEIRDFIEGGIEIAGRAHRLVGNHLVGPVQQAIIGRGLEIEMTDNVIEDRRPRGR